MDLGVKNLVNRDHSLILSLDKIYIGGSLDENHQATGYANFIDNGSATIEALGDGKIKTASLLNHDLHLVLGKHYDYDKYTEYRPWNKSDSYLSTDGWMNWNNGSRHDKNAYWHTKDGEVIASPEWEIINYTRTTETTTIENRDPSKILIGGNLNLQGGEFINDKSTIAVGKTLRVGDREFTQNSANTNLDGISATLKNIDLVGEIHRSDKFTATHMGVERHHKRTHKVWGHYNHGTSPFARTLPVETFNFGLDLNPIGEKRNENNSVANQVVADGISLPTASLYKINLATESRYLVETDSRFTNKKQWLSSDYMFNALRYDPQNMLKRLGDGYYEQRLVNEQINQLTGDRYLDGYQSDYEQYKALMDSGIHYAKAHNLVLGVALTAEQMAELTSDLVWFVEKTVTLNDGTTTSVLAPQVYIAPNNVKVTPVGAVISANNIVVDVQGDIDNRGTISAKNLTALSGQNINNSGTISGNTVALSAVENINVLGGTLNAKERLTAMANNVNIESTTSSAKSADGKFVQTDIDKVAKINVTGKNSSMTLFADNNVTVKGANVNVIGDSQMIAENTLNLGTVATSNREHYGSGDNYYNLDQTSEVGNKFNLNGNATLMGKSAVEMTGNSVSSNGTVNMASNGDVNIKESRQTEQLDSAYKAKYSTGLSRVTQVGKHYHETDMGVGSQIDAENVNIQSTKGNVTVQGSDVVAGTDLTIQAKNVNIKESDNSSYEENFESTKKSGLMGSGGFGFSIGQRKESLSTDETQHYARGSQVGALSGDVAINAYETYLQQASTVTSVKGDVDIHAQKVDIKAADDTYETNSKYVYEQKGLTIALSTPMLDMMNSIASTVKSTKNIGASKDDRINALAAANTGWAAYRLYQNAETIGNMASDLMNGNLGSDGAGGSAVGVSITYGQQKNVSTTHTEGNTATKSAVNAGGSVNITATGAGKQSDINIIGTDVSGKQGTTLKADDEVNLLAAKQSHMERSKNKSSGFNAGVAVMIGDGISVGITAGGNYGKGYGNGDETTYAYTHVGDANSQTNIESGAITTLKGAQVQGKGVKLSASDLNIESLQETLTYKGKQMNVSGQVTVGYGFSASGSYSQSKMNADYASVVEQSGIYAGDDGYQIDIQNHTDLKGGLITSSQTAEDNGKNNFETGTLSYADIRNHADYSGSSFGIGGGFSMGGGEGPKEIGGMKLKEIGQNAVVETVNSDGSRTSDVQGQINVNKAIGFGYDSDHDSSVTKSGINTANIKIRDEQAQVEKTGKSAEATIAGVKTDITTQSAVENSGKLEQNFDRDKLQDELDTQLEVTQTFDQNRQELKSIYYQKIDEKRAEATEIRRNNGGYDTELSKQLDQEADDLNEQIRWIDMGLGVAWGLGNADMTQLMLGTTQADRVYRSATAPKEMWIQHCSSSQSKDCQSRQIWSLDDLTIEERTRLENGNIQVISNPGILNDREDSLKNAQKQNQTDANQNGIITVMNPPTGDYKGWNGWKLATTLPSELMYALYDKFNDGLFHGLLPLTNSEKLNQDIYLEAKSKGYVLDVSNHSRGGMTASVALQNLNIWKGINEIPIRKARFYGTATNVQAYSDHLRDNGFTYQGKDGKTYQSGTYSAVHHSDGVGLIPIILGGNSATGGACWLCYSHSSYFAEVPDPISQKEDYKEFIKIWGVPTDNTNSSHPRFAVPSNKLSGDQYDEKAF